MKLSKPDLFLFFINLYIIICTLLIREYKWFNGPNQPTVTYKHLKRRWIRTASTWDLNGLINNLYLEVAFWVGAKLQRIAIVFDWDQ
jgi:hypothetical protein